MGVASIFLKPRRLEKGENLKDFSCGVPLIDTWARERVASAVKHGTAVPYVSFTVEGEVAGFYTLSAYSIDRDSMPGGWLRRNTPDCIPAILIGMLGVSQQFQGKGLGWKLLHEAVTRARSISQQLGLSAIIVEPYDDSARSFYAHFGFNLIPGSNSMYWRLA